MLVSVVIPVYNAAKWIGKAVASIVNQEYVGEVLLVEDGSNDKSFSVCKELAAIKPQVRLLRHDAGGNFGAGASRNLGIRHAKFEFIAFLDADDVCLPDRFGPPLQILAENPTIDGVYEAIGTIFEDKNAHERWNSLDWGNLTTIRKVLQPKELFYYLVMWEAGHFHLDGLVIKKNLLCRVGLFNSHLRLHQDTDICIKLAAEGNLLPGRLNKPVALRRIHSANRFVKNRKNALQTGLLMLNSLENWAKKSNQSFARRLLICHIVNKELAAYYHQKRKWLSAFCHFALSRLMHVAIFVRRSFFGKRSF